MARAKPIYEWGMHPGIPQLARQAEMFLTYAEARALGPDEILREVRDIKRLLVVIEESVYSLTGQRRAGKHKSRRPN